MQKVLRDNWDVAIRWSLLVYTINTLFFVSLFHFPALFICSLLRQQVTMRIRSVNCKGDVIWCLGPTPCSVWLNNSCLMALVTTTGWQSDVRNKEVEIQTQLVKWRLTFSVSIFTNIYRKLGADRSRTAI